MSAHGSRRALWIGPGAAPALALGLALGLGACSPPSAPAGRALFTEDPPADRRYRDEIDFMRTSAGFSPELDQHIRSKVGDAAAALSMPPALLWCVLFQESRLDRLKNAFNDQSAKGIGQFTSIALTELNGDTDLYDPRTGRFLASQIGAKPVPITFTLGPKAPATSYFRLDTGVASTAAYLNNRYRQLTRTLDRLKLSYDPQVLWLLAAAAYNKGPRALNVFLNRLRQIQGRQRLLEVLKDPDTAVAELSNRKSLRRVFFFLWEKERRQDLVDEMGANMQAVARCALAGAKEAR